MILRRESGVGNLIAAHMAAGHVNRGQREISENSGLGAIKEMTRDSVSLRPLDTRRLKVNGQGAACATTFHGDLLDQYWRV